MARPPGLASGAQSPPGLASGAQAALGITDTVQLQAKLQAVLDSHSCSRAPLNYANSKLKECLRRIQDSERTTSAMRKGLEWLGSDQTNEEPVQIVFPVLIPTRADVGESLAAACFGPQVARFMLQYDKYLFVISSILSPVFVVSFFLVCLREKLLYIPFQFVAFAISAVILVWGWGVFVCNLKGLKLLLTSFDVYFIIANSIISGITGASLFDDPALRWVWGLSFITLGSVACFMDAHPNKVKLKGLYAIFFVFLVCSFICVFFDIFHIFDTTVFIYGKGISMRYRALSSLLAMTIFALRYVVSAFRKSKVYVLCPVAQVEEITESEVTALRSAVEIVTKAVLLARRTTKGGKSVLLKRKYTKEINKDASVPRRRFSNVTKAELAEIEQPDKILDLPTSSSDKYSDADVVTLVFRAEVLCQTISLELLEFFSSRIAAEEQGMLAESVIIDALKELISVTNHAVEVKKRKTFLTFMKRKSSVYPDTCIAGKKLENAKKKTTISLCTTTQTLPIPKHRYLLATFQPSILESEKQTLALFIGGPRLLHDLRAIMRTRIFKLVHFSSTTLLCLPLTLGLLFTGDDHMLAAFTVTITLIGLVCTIMQAGLYNVKMLSIIGDSFFTWFFMLLLLNITICGVLCGSKPLIKIQWVALMFIVALCILGDALPSRKLTRQCETAASAASILFLSSVGIGIWRELLIGFEEYELVIFGVGLELRETLMSTAFTVSVYMIQFTYRGLTSETKLFIKSGVYSCRLSRSHARFVMAAQPAQK